MQQQQLSLIGGTVPDQKRFELEPKFQRNKSKQVAAIQPVENQLIQLKTADSALAKWGYCQNCGYAIAIPGLDAAWCANCGWVRGSAV